MTEAIYVNNTAAAPATITTSDVAAFTGNIKPTMYNNARISAFLEIQTTGTSVTTNTLAVKIKLSGNLLTGATYNFKTDAVVRTLPFPIEYIGDISQGGPLTITVSAAGTDTGTTVIVKRVYVTSIA